MIHVEQLGMIHVEQYTAITCYTYCEFEKLFSKQHVDCNKENMPL